MSFVIPPSPRAPLQVPPTEPNDAADQRRACDDARSTGTGSYGAWLQKVKSDSAVLKWITVSTTRYFTLDFNGQCLSYSNSESALSISHLISFKDILWAERAPADGGFLVRTEDRTYELYASSNADAALWVRGLNLAHELGMPERGGRGARARPPMCTKAVQTDEEPVEVDYECICEEAAAAVQHEGQLPEDILSDSSVSEEEEKGSLPEHVPSSVMEIPMCSSDESVLPVSWDMGSEIRHADKAASIELSPSSYACYKASLHFLNGAWRGS